jgi:hypothetical protein
VSKDRTTTEAMAADMTTGTFAYHVVLTEDDPQPVSLIAAWIETGQSLQAIPWIRPDQTWIYAPAVAAQRLYDDQYQNRRRQIDRNTAEHIALEALRTELPSETALQAMVAEGQQMDWTYGPPRQ